MKLLTKSINITPVEGIFRNIVERSIMTNNDERVVYSREKWEEVPQSAPSGVSLVISRPHFTCEGDIYLDKSKWDRENAPKITVFLDDVFRLKTAVERKQFLDELCGRESSPSDILANIIASNFYDCMSGGMPAYMGQLVRELCLDDRVKKDSQVYPGKGKSGEEWFTIDDFLKELKPLDEGFAKLLE